MKKFLLLFLLVFASASMAQDYPVVSIHDIQYLPDSVIALGDAPSPLNGDTVIVTGICMVSPLVSAQTDRRPIIAAGGRWVSYVMDPDNNEWAGLNVIQHDTTGDNQLTGYQNLDTADVFQFVAVIEEYFTSTQAALLINPISEIEVLETLPKRPEPIELSISDFMNGGQYVNESEKYESQYVVIREGVTSDRNTTSGVFRINDGNGNYINMYDQSGYFTKRGHRLTGITDYEPPLDGSTVEMIRGIMTTRTDGYYLVPLYPGDLVTSFDAPNIQFVDRASAKVGKNEAMDVEARVAPGAGALQEVEVFFQVNGGVWDSVAMNESGNADSMYTGQIPGIDADSALVRYFIKAEDAAGFTNTNPFDTASARYFYMVKDGDIAVQDVQYSPFGSGYSSMNNFTVTVTGVVTADTNDFPNYVYIQNGQGPWSGIRIMGSFVDTLSKGDMVEVTGLVNENFSVTALGTITDGVEFTLLSEGNELPTPEVITTGEIGTVASGTIEAEKWESVLVKFENILVAAANADGANNYGEMLIDDNSGGTRVELQDGLNSYHNNWTDVGSDPTRTIEILTGDSFDALQGIMYYSFGNYKLLPRQDSDFIGFTTDLEEAGVPDVYSLSQNYPNPFNPSTMIEYSLPEASVVTVRVYDILGREVAELVNEFKNQGTYKVSFDASRLASGVYLYRVEAGKFNSVKKMVLMK